LSDLESFAAVDSRVSALEKVEISFEEVRN
jgi:hypothetical protein